MLFYFVYVEFLLFIIQNKIKIFLSTLWFRPVHQYPFHSIHKNTIQLLFNFSHKYCPSLSVVSESVEFSFITIILSAYYLCNLTNNIFSALKAFNLNFSFAIPNLDLFLTILLIHESRFVSHFYFIALIQLFWFIFVSIFSKSAVCCCSMINDLFSTEHRAEANALRMVANIERRSSYSNCMCARQYQLSARPSKTN